MASADYLILSSPPRQFSTFDMSSSPVLPSLNEILQRRPSILRAESRAAPIPQSATATFASAAQLLNRAPSIELQNAELICSFALREEDEDSKERTTKPTVKPRKSATKNVEDGQEKVMKAPRRAAVKKDTVDGEEKSKKPRKPRAKKIEEGGETDGAVKATAPRKPRVKKSDKDNDGDGASKEKPVRKSRAKKLSEGSQTKIPKGKVTKASTAKSNAPGALASSKTAVLESLTDDFGLAEAVRRRANWTPPAPRVKPVNTTPLPTDIFNSWLASDGSIGSGEGKKGFADLLGNFGFTKGGKSAEEKRLEDVELTRKRKLIELVKTNVSVAGSISPTKEKAPKKKARTITDQATSAYVNEEEEDATKTAPLLQYFISETTDRPSNDKFKVPAKPRAKSPVKGLKTKKKATAQAPILLSPESALKQARNQDYVFGTSSQLAREDSPTLLRDLHEAMQASNEADDDYDDPFAGSVFNSAPAPLPDQCKMSLPIKRNLWSAAARDDDGQLMEVEMIDLANSSPPIGRASNTESKMLASVPLFDAAEEGWHDIEQITQSLEQSKPVERGPKPSGLLRNELLISPPSSGQISMPLTKAFSVARDPKAISKPTTKLGVKTSTKEIPEMPNFSLYSTAQLTKEFKSYGFKAIKSNNKMIETLQECWRNKHRVALEALDSNMAISAQPEPPKQALKSSSQATTISPKRPRARPRKDDKASSPQTSTSKSSKTKAVENVEGLEIDSDTLSQIRTPKNSPRKKTALQEDIDDPDGPSTPSPPRRQASQIGKGPLPLPLSSPYGSANLSPNSSQKALFKYISRAVKSAESSRDPQNPSWYEKILLYDPIILEELTIWLNTGALGKVGWDDEVEPKEVKKWCESKSICCLWRENLRGGARSRY